MGLSKILNNFFLNLDTNSMPNSKIFFEHSKSQWPPKRFFFANRKPLFKHGIFKEKDIFWNPKSKHKISNLFFEFCTHRKNHRHAKFCVSKNLNVDLFFCLKIELKTTFWKNNFKTSDLIWKFTNRKAKHFFSSRDFEKTFWNFEKLLIKPKNENL